MKTFVLTLLFAIGLLLIWVGDLRLMLTGLFLTIDSVSAQIYFSFQAADERLVLAVDTLVSEIGKRLKAKA